MPEGAPSVIDSPEPAPAALVWFRTTSGRLFLRWSYIALLTVVAFHRSLAILVQATVGDTLNGYIWMVLVAGLLATIGIASRERRELPIHDRETDIIVGAMVLGVALLLHGVLLARYTVYFSLLRLDLVAMGWFVLGCTIVLFGLRPVIRYAPVWVILLLLFPLPYHVLVVALGSNRAAAALATLVVPVWAAGICVGSTRRRALIGAAMALGVGLGVVAVMVAATPEAPLFAYQVVPSLTAVLVTVAVRFRRGSIQRPPPRELAPLATKQVWSAVPMVAVVAVLLALVPLPRMSVPSDVAVSGAGFWKPLPVPPGWHEERETEYPRVARLYGADASFIRQQIRADVGNPKWDKLSQPRLVVIDSISTRNPFAFDVYPSITLYPLPRSRVSPPRAVDLGAGVVAQLFSATDDQLLVTWNVMVWTWHHRSVAQRILMFSVDFHEDGAPIPEPGHSVPSVLNSLLVVLFRGNAAVSNQAAQFKDADMLAEVGRKVVAAQIESHP